MPFKKSNTWDDMLPMVDIICNHWALYNCVWLAFSIELNCSPVTHCSANMLLLGYNEQIKHKLSYKGLLLQSTDIGGLNILRPAQSIDNPVLKYFVQGVTSALVLLEIEGDKRIELENRIRMNGRREKICLKKRLKLNPVILGCSTFTFRDVARDNNKTKN